MQEQNKNQINPVREELSKWSANRFWTFISKSGVAVSIVAALSYIAAYLHELKYCNSFCIPNDFIMISWTRFSSYAIYVFIGIIIWFLILWLLDIPINALSVKLENHRKVRLWILSLAMLVSGGICLTMINLGNAYANLIYDSAVLLLYAFAAVCAYRIIRLQIQSLKHYIYVVDAFFTFCTLCVVLLFPIVIASLETGNYEAINKKDFLVTSTDPKLVVLRVYGDNMICAPLHVDNTSGSDMYYISQDFTIMKISNISVTPTEIFPLEVHPSCNQRK